MTEETLALTLPWHLRARMWLTHPATWVQVGSFLAVGGVGYVVNLAIYALAVHALRLDYRDSAVVAFAVALTTTFVLNRRYTFGATNGEMHQQAWRYVLVSGVAFGANLVVLQFLVERGALAKVPAEAIAAVFAAPVNYAGQRLWAFARGTA